MKKQVICLILCQFLEINCSIVKSLNGCGRICGIAEPPRNQNPHSSRVKLASEEDDYYPEYDEHKTDKSESSEGNLK